MDILRGLYNEFSDELHRQKNGCREYMEMMGRYGGIMERMESVLTSEQRKLFMEVEAQRNLIAAEDEEWMFCCGFRMGARLMAEILLASK